MGYLGVRWWKVPFIARYMRRLMHQEIRGIHLFPGVKELLGELKARSVKIVILSSNSRENVHSVLGESVSLIECFECGVGIFSKKKKLLKLLKRFNLSSSEVLSIGDEIRDLEAARAVGVLAGAITWG